MNRCERPKRPRAMSERADLATRMALDDAKAAELLPDFLATAPRNQGLPFTVAVSESRL